MSFFGNMFNSGGGGGNVPYNSQTAWGGTGPTNQAPALLGNINTGNANYNTANTGQNQLVAQLQAQAQGGGPNPAQAMLNQATNQNIAQGAGMISSQKGISPALAAQQVANQTASANQQAAGQGAVMRANQTLQAQGLLGNTLANQSSGANQNLGINQGALSNQNSSIANATSAATGQNASQAASTYATNNTLLGGLGLARGGEVPKYAEGGQTLLTSIIPNQNTGQTYNNSQTYMNQYQPPQQQQQTPALWSATGNQSPLVYGVKQLYNAFTGPSMPSDASQAAGQAQAAGMESGSDLAGGDAFAGADAGAAGAADAAGGAAIDAGGSDAAAALLAAKGGQVDKIKTRLMPDHLKLVHSLYHTPKMSSGGVPTQNMKQGGPVPGEPKYPHTNTTKQDDIPAMLTSKEIVLPLTVTQSNNPAQAAFDFVSKIKEKEGYQKPKDDFKGAISRAAQQRKAS